MVNRKLLLASALGIVLSMVAVYFVWTGIQIRQSEFAMLEALKKPTGRIGFWNMTNKQIVLKLTYGNGDFTWAVLSPEGGQFGSHDTGVIRIERILDEMVLARADLTLSEGGEVNFAVYENRILPKWSEP